MIYDILLQLIFWGCLLALVHSYVVYPVLVKKLARRKCSRSQSDSASVYSEKDAPADWPYLVVMIAAHNEEAVIAETLESIFGADYPDERIEVIVAADNCSDRTHEIVESFSADHTNLQLRIFPGRNGKIRVINQVVNESREALEGFGDYVLILGDANVRWSTDLPRNLAKHFKNSRIGQVAPNVLDSRLEHRGIADYEEAYVNRENQIKHAEGLLWGRTMGAFGACYALRGRLFQAVPDNFVVDDFFHSMRCFETGHDAITEPDAHCFEDVSEDIGEEFRRKRRIAIGNLQNLVRFRKLLSNPFGDFGTFFAFWSHKGIRWFGPFLLAGAFFSSLILASSHPIYALALLGQIALFLTAAGDALLSRVGIHFKLSRSLRYFYLMNLALMLGFIRFLGGVKSNVWEPTRRVTPTRVAHASVPSNDRAANSKADKPAQPRH